MISIVALDQRLVRMLVANVESFYVIFVGKDYNRRMEIRFDKPYLEELYLKGKSSDKKHRFQPQIIGKYRKTIDLLESIAAVKDLYRFHSLRYEVLMGDKAGIESVRVNDQYRIEFKTTKVESEIVVTVCNIIELSNHYK